MPSMSPRRSRCRPAAYQARIDGNAPALKTIIRP
jgi:hypothetical protein